MTQRTAVVLIVALVALVALGLLYLPATAWSMRGEGRIQDGPSRPDGLVGLVRVVDPVGQPLPGSKVECWGDHRLLTTLEADRRGEVEVPPSTEVVVSFSGISAGGSILNGGGETQVVVPPGAALVVSLVGQGVDLVAGKTVGWEEGARQGRLVFGKRLGESSLVLITGSAPERLPTRLGLLVPSDAYEPLTVQAGDWQEARSMTWQVGSFSPLRIRSREGKVKFRFARRPAGRGLSKFFATTLHSVDPLGVVFAAGSDRGNYDVVWKTYRRRGVVSVPDQGDTLVVDDRSPAVEGELSLPRLAPCEQSQARIWLTAWADGQRVGRQEFADSLGEKRPTFSEELDERIAAALDSHGKVEISLAMKTSIGGVEKWIGESTRIILESDDGPRHSLSVVSIAANNRIVVDGSVTYSDDQAPFGGLVGLQRETSSGWQGISTMTCGDRGGFVFRERVDEVSAVSRFRVVAMDGGGIQAASGPFLAGSRGVNVRVRRAGVRTAKVRISVDAPSMVGTYRILMRDNDGAEVLNGFLKAGDQDVEIPYGSYDARLTVWRETVWSREGLVISGDSKVDIDLSSEIVCGEVEVLDSVTGERIGGASIRRTDGRPYWEEGGPGVVVVRSGDMPRVGDAFIRARGRMPMEPIEGAELPRICVSRADRLCEVAAPGYVSTQFELKTDRNVVRMARGRSHSLEVVCPVSLPISVRLDLEIVDRDVAPRYITEADQGDRRFTVFRAGGGKVSVMAFLVEKGKPTGSRKWRPLGRVECDLDDAKTQVRIPESALRGAIEALK